MSAFLFLNMSLKNALLHHNVQLRIQKLSYFILKTFEIKNKKKWNPTHLFISLTCKSSNLTFNFLDLIHQSTNSHLSNPIWKHKMSQNSKCQKLSIIFTLNCFVHQKDQSKVCTYQNNILEVVHFLIFLSMKDKQSY